MRIIYMANNWMGWQVAEWLQTQPDNIVGLVVHPEHMAKYREQIEKASGMESHSCFFGDHINDKETVSALKDLDADICISVSFGFILLPQVINLFPYGCINLHPAYLPYNRGGYPNVWSIVDGTPAGATLHYIDEGVDTGEIIAREKTPVELTDTGETLYHKLERTGIDLFKKTWPLIRSGEAISVPQEEGEGTSHFDRDVRKIDRIDADASYRALDLINILRARTFPPYDGAYYMDGGKRIYMRLSLYEKNGGGEP